MLGKRQIILHRIIHQIDTGLSKSIHRPPKRLGFKEREHVHAHVADLLKSDVICKSMSSWSSRIVLYKKKDDVYPLSSIDYSLSILLKGQYFSIIDLYAGYWMRVSKKKTAFSTDSGLYEYNDCLLVQRASYF